MVEGNYQIKVRVIAKNGCVELAKQKNIREMTKNAKVDLTKNGLRQLGKNNGGEL